MLMRCLESIGKSTYRSLELIVVDDLSGDETKDLLAEDIQRRFNFDDIPVRVIHGSVHMMMVRSRNTGAQASKGAYVLFVDDDNEIDFRMIEELVRFFQSQPGYGVAGPAMHLYSTRAKYMDGQRINFFTGKTQGYFDRKGLEFCDTQGVPNVLMVRNEVFEEVGYFDEDLIQTFTEPDFSFHAAKFGYKSALVKKAKTYHDIPTGPSPRTLGGHYKHKAYCTMRNRAVIIARYGRWYHRMTYMLLFSWLWAAVYSSLVLPFGRWDLVRFYWCGWRDGVIYCLTGKLINSLPRIAGSLPTNRPD